MVAETGAGAGATAVLDVPADPSPSAAAERIVVIDDDYVMRLSCSQILTKMGFEVEVFEDGASGLEGVARLKPALVVVDLKMPGLSGMEVVQRIHELDAEIVVLVITGYATISTAVDAMKSGAYDFLPKPFSPDEMRVVVSRGLERRRLILESRRHELERELLRRRFVTFVSHQLQTPLVAIHQYLDVLQRLEESPDVVAKRRDWIERCLTRTAEMQALIRDWLLLAQVESGALLQRREPVALHVLIIDIVRTYEEMAASASVRLETALEADPDVVAGDHSGLVVLLDNLLVNAIKYNRPGGSVTVHTERALGEIIVSVADTGVGVAAADLPFLFDEFYRVRGSSAVKTQGTGLGLPICKRIVAELGGAIEVASEEHTGSTFRVRLPVGTPRQPERHGEVL